MAPVRREGGLPFTGPLIDCRSAGLDAEPFRPIEAQGDAELRLYVTEPVRVNAIEHITS